MVVGDILILLVDGDGVCLSPLLMLTAGDRFTLQHSMEKATFLDLDIYKGTKFRETGYLDTKLHIKSTNPQSYLHFSSCHPNYIFQNIIRSEILRTLRATSDEDIYQGMLQQLLTKFTSRGYPIELFHRVADSISFGQRQYHLASRPQQQLPPEVVFFSVPHHPALDYSAIRRITSDDHTPFSPMVVRRRSANHGDLVEHNSYHQLFSEYEFRIFRI